MRRISTGLSVIVIMMTLGWVVLLTQLSNPVSAQTAVRAPDLSSPGIDFMPVGTAKQIAKLKRGKVKKA